MSKNQTKHCINCGIEISETEYETYNGYCQECYLLLFPE
jgi:NMD protein affecting ribosome stability and mRNA decay